MLEGALPVNGGKLADLPRPNQFAEQQPLRDAQARIEFLEQMVHRLEVALLTMMMQARSKAHSEPTLHEIHLACQRLGLRPAAADSVLDRLRHYGAAQGGSPSGDEVPARMCPAVGGDSECRGNACGLTCEAALL